MIYLPELVFVSDVLRYRWSIWASRRHDALTYESTLLTLAVVAIMEQAIRHSADRFFMGLATHGGGPHGQLDEMLCKRTLMVTIVYGICR
jgi:hypothetical protein